MKKLIAAAAVATMASGCLWIESSANAPIVLNVKAPVSSYVDNSVKPLKIGKATASGIICFTEGDASIKAAMENGGIQKVHHVDYEVKNIFGIVGSTTTIVYGE